MKIQDELRALGDKKRAVLVAHYFKTGKGEYGEGDVFIGLTVPQVRAVARKYRELPLREVEKLLHNKIHEFRLTALLILCAKFEKASERDQKNIVDLYVRNTEYINNWDLVDLSSHEILGVYLLAHPGERKMLYTFARSKNLWEKRIAVISTFAFLREKDFADALALGELLLHDPHDLIQKAVGWMLREVGKRDLAAEEAFLQQHYRVMSRIMLRYAIEKFPLAKRLQYLKRS
jgi:3-methyladenine DNA glycosylase AlkD